MKRGMRNAMGNRRGWISLMLLTVLLSGLPEPGGAALAKGKAYATLSDIQEEVRDGWRQTYTFHGETIVVNVDVEVPDVDAVPALRVRCVGQLPPFNAPENAVIDVYPQEGFFYSVQSKPGTISADSTKGRYRWLQDYADDAQAENSPFTREEALAFVEDTIAPYVELCGSFAYELRQMYVETRGYKVLSGDATHEVLDKTQTCTEMGVYQIALNQRFHGISFRATRLPFTWPLKIEEGLLLAVGEMTAIVGSDQDYVIAFYPVMEDAVLTPDLPLTPFAEVQKELERLIESGYLRSVYSVRLTYCIYNNPDDLHNTFILLPVWEVTGVYVQSPKDPTPSPKFEDEETERQFGGMAGYVNAQTGQYLDPEDQTRTRSFGVYLTWDEVK